MNGSSLGLIEMLSIFGIGIALVLWQVIAIWRERRRDRLGRGDRPGADQGHRPKR